MTSCSHSARLTLSSARSVAGSTHSEDSDPALCPRAETGHSLTQPTSSDSEMGRPSRRLASAAVKPRFCSRIRAWVSSLPTGAPTVTQSRADAGRSSLRRNAVPIGGWFASRRWSVCSNRARRNGPGPELARRPEASWRSAVRWRPRRAAAASTRSVRRVPSPAQCSRRRVRRAAGVRVAGVGRCPSTCPASCPIRV